MGPWATLNFFEEILNNTEAEKDWLHLHIIIDNNVRIPSRTRSLLYNEESPVAAMKDACYKLMSIGCDYIAVPCNSAHYFYDDVVANTDIPWVNMLEVVARQVTHYKKVLVLGGYVTIVKKSYDRYLDNTIYLDDYDEIYELIESVKVNNVHNKPIQLPEADCILLACTELPLVIKDGVDAGKIYAKELIKLCGGKVKEQKSFGIQDVNIHL
jgi:aspartate racemase